MWNYFFLGIGSIVAGGLAWRFASRRWSLPCPYWLGWLIENRFTDAFAGNLGSGFILKHLNIEPGMNILDVGAGCGRITLPAAKQVLPGGEVAALDIQEPVLRTLKERAAAAGLTNIRIIHGGTGEGRLQPGIFDRALLVTVLGEIPDREAALGELFTVLKPGGILSITESLIDPHYQRRRTVRRIASSVGFKEVEYFGSWLSFTIHFMKP